MFQDLRHKDDSITCLRPNEFKDVLFKSLKEKFGPSMLQVKSADLIAKLDLI